MAKVNDAFSTLRRRESLVDKAHPGYLGRMLLEAYGEWPGDFSVGITAEGPGLPNTWPRDDESRKVHAGEIDQLADILKSVREPIINAAVPISSPPPEARGATPFVKLDGPTQFSGRAVIESWNDGSFHLWVETPKELSREDKYQFAVDCIDKILLTLAIRSRNLRTGRKF